MCVCALIVRLHRRHHSAAPHATTPLRGPRRPQEQAAQEPVEEARQHSPLIDTRFDSMCSMRRAADRVVDKQEEEEEEEAAALAPGVCYVPGGERGLTHTPAIFLCLSNAPAQQSTGIRARATHHAL